MRLGRARQGHTTRSLATQVESWVWGCWWGNFYGNVRIQERDGRHGHTVGLRKSKVGTGKVRKESIKYGFERGRTLILGMELPEERFQFLLVGLDVEVLGLVAEQVDDNGDELSRR